MLDKKLLLEEIFINYKGELMFVGRHKSNYNIIGYVLCCNIDELDEAFETKLQDAKIHGIFKEYSYTEKNQRLFEPGSCGYCFLCNGRFDILSIKETILVEVEEKKKNLEILTKDNPTLIESLNVLVNKHPNTYSLDRSYSVDLVMNWLSFIDNFDCLLLSDEKEVRDLYIKYKTKQTRCFKSKVRKFGRN